jgi:Na+/melibiose symporter-like transporter
MTGGEGGEGWGWLKGDKVEEKIRKGKFHPYVSSVSFVIHLIFKLLFVTKRSLFVIMCTSVS